jgi:hypothetical protein
MGEFCMLYLLCMLRFPVPLHSLQGWRDLSLLPVTQRLCYSLQPKVCFNIHIIGTSIRPSGQWLLAAA